MAPLFLIPLVLAAIPILLGIGMAQLAGTRGHAYGLAGISLLSVVAGALAFTEQGAGVSAWRALLGACIVGLFAVLGPFSVFFELGYRVRSRALLVFVWLLATVLFGYYLLVVLFIGGALINCAPGSNECFG